MRTLSIRQPYAEQILRGIKRFEYRSRSTAIRERVYIYASRKPGPVLEFKRMRIDPGELLTGVLVGTIEIIDCSGKPGDYRWHLARPRRLKRPVRPTKHPQPVWFNPFYRRPPRQKHSLALAH
jgi:ASCH domain-containing protein